MKRIIILAVCVAMFCSLVGCTAKISSEEKGLTDPSITIEVSISDSDTIETTLNYVQTDEVNTEPSDSAQTTEEVSVSDSGKTEDTSTDTNNDTEPSVQPPSEDVHIHTYEKTVVAPTCTKKGYTLNKCSCGESYKNSYKNKVDHSFGDWVVTIKASYFGEGKESRYCTFCGKEESKVLPIIPHYTCEERGIDVYEVQRLALEYVNTLEGATADPTLIGTDRGGMAGWTLRIFTYAYKTQEQLLDHVKSALFTQYKTCIEFYDVSLHALLEEDPEYPGDYVFYILYN